MEETAFPRGRRRHHHDASDGDKKEDAHHHKRKRTKTQHHDDNNTVVSDFLFGTTITKTTSTTTFRKKRKKTESSAGTGTIVVSSSSILNNNLGGGGVIPPQLPKKKEPYIEALSFSKLGKGTKLLGIVREVQSEYAVLSLPNLLSGYVLKREKDHFPLTHVLSIGQVLAVSIVKTAMETIGSGKQQVTRRRIQVSVLPSALNHNININSNTIIRGQIKSIEDHGCLIDLGQQQQPHGIRRQGFLPFDQVEGEYSTAMVEDDVVVKHNNANHNQKHMLNPGRILDFLVRPHHNNNHNKTETKIVPLSLPSDLSKVKLTTAENNNRADQTVTLSTLNPGSLVKARIEAHARNGLCVVFLDGLFRGAIESSHLGGYWIPQSTKNSSEETKWKELFVPKKMTIMARIICVDAITKIVRLSLLPHILEFKAPSPTRLPEVGTVIENATVIRLDAGVGALLALPSSLNESSNTDDDDDNVAAALLLNGPLAHEESYVKASRVRAAYVHISKAMDAESGQTTKRTPESVFGQHFAPSTQHTCRIMSTSNWIEGIASCATADSIVEAHVLTHADLVPGKLYRNVPVSSHLEAANSGGGGGIIVNFGMGVRGLIPSQHLFDHSEDKRSKGSSSSSSAYRAKLRRTKFAVGNKVDVRVLTVDERSKRCVLTAKPTLIKNIIAGSGGGDEDIIISSYENVTPGKLATGFISNVDDRGLYVTFYNNVYGRVTARSLAAELGVENHRVDYRVGDVVKCRVVNCRKKKILTSSSASTDETDERPKKRDYWELNLSLNLHPSSNDDNQEDAEQCDSAVRLRAGAVLPPKSMKILELVKCKPKESGGFIPGYAIVSAAGRDGKEASVGDVECKLPFDQLMDSYNTEYIETAEALNSLAERLLTVGKKINQRSLVLTDPRKSPDDYVDGTGPLPIVSLRPKLITTAETFSSKEAKSNGLLLPTHDTHLFMGAYVHGVVMHIDPRYGAFVRFLDNLTGLVPKLKKGLELPLYETVTCRIMALDVTARPMKILLKKAKYHDAKKDSGEAEAELPDVKPGDKIGKAVIVHLNFVRATVKLHGEKYGSGKNIRARVHYSMAQSTPLSAANAKKKRRKDKNKSGDYKKQRITKCHPFYKWKVGMKLSDLTCAAVDIRNNVAYIELTNRSIEEMETERTAGRPKAPIFVEETSELQPNMFVSGVVSFVPENNRGLWVQVCPGVEGYVPAFELSMNADVLNNLRAFYPVGARIDCCVLDKSLWQKKKLWGAKSPRSDMEGSEKKKKNDVVFLSSLMMDKGLKTSDSGDSNSAKKASPSLQPTKPLRGDLVLGRINRNLPQRNAPALMLELRGGFVGRCCITELEEMDDWMNMPLGRMQPKSHNKNNGKAKHIIVTDEEEESEDGDAMDVDEEPEDDDEDSKSDDQHQHGQYPHGKYVTCRVLAGIPSCPMLEVSLRSSRLEGDIDDDSDPEVKEMVQAYVIDTNKKGCFVRLSRHVEGRVILKEIADGFVIDPAAMFPMGRLVAGKVKAVRESKNATTTPKKNKRRKDPVRAIVDLDMRESTLLESKDKLEIEEVKVGTKHRGIVTRIESYGVFVRLENSDVSGLVHKSECSDDYIKNLSNMYDPGDLVKVLVVKADAEHKRIGLSMKASHFEDDEDSDDDSSIDSFMDDDDDDASQSDEDEEMPDAIVSDSDDDSIASDDENYATKLAAKIQAQEGDDDDHEDKAGDGSEDDSADSSESDEDESSDEEGDDDDNPATERMDTDVGFDWGAGVSSSAAEKSKETHAENSSSSDDDSDDDMDDQEAAIGAKSRHKSRKKAAARRREEQEIARRERALADGTADENPETTSDFERLLASEPNRSEHWIRYMAYHLSLADVQSARSVAQRAFDRIEFRQEREKLNVWTALLTLELKYGTQESLEDTIDRACKHNNPKQVYLRVCEMLEREVDNTSGASLISSDKAVGRADEMFVKMCKKFKSKKTVWIAHLQYLLKSGRHQEAHALLKRSLTSLPEYKHLETMSKFAQLEFEHGSPERGRTIFDGLLQKYPKRLDLLFVYVDKEVKKGEIDAARALFENIIDSDKNKLSDKQMKSLFKKWYRLEEAHGTDESQEHVKNAARAYVEQTSKA